MAPCSSSGIAVPWATHRGGCFYAVSDEARVQLAALSDYAAFQPNLGS